MTFARRPSSNPMPRRVADRCLVTIVASIAAVCAALAGAPAARADEQQDVAKLVANGKLDEAQTRADAFLAKNPKDAQMRFLKGVVLSQRGHREDAIAVFTGLTQDYPELPEPYNNLAVIYAAQGRYDDARNALEMAIRVAPNDATAYDNLGDVYAAMAARAYRDARRYDANDAGALRKLDAIRALLTGPAATAAAAPAAAAAPEVPAPPDARSQRYVGLGQPAAPSTLMRFGSEAPEIVVPSVGTAVPQGSNVVGVGTPDADAAKETTTLAGASTTIPPDPANPIPSIAAAVQSWAASRSLSTGPVSIRVDGDVATARFREEQRNVRRTISRNHALTLHRNGGGWAVTDDRIES